MGLFDERLQNIVGYHTSEEGMIALSKGCYMSRTNDLEFNPFIDDLIFMVTALAGALYRDADISDYVETLQNSAYGPTIRKAIYDIFRELSRASHIYIYSELCAIKSAHFGRDMRQPIYDALKKLGIDQDLYVQTTGDDYIWYEDSGDVTIVRYIGPAWPYIIMPETIDGNTVTTVSSLTFNGNKTIMGVKFPANATSI